MLYDTLKFIHVLAVVAWVGGLIAMAVFAGVAARRDLATLGPVARTGAELGGFFGASSGVAFLAGLAMMFTDRGPDFSAAYINIGFIAFFITAFLGARVIGPGYAKMALAADAGDVSAVNAARKTAAIPLMSSLALLVITIAAMVFQWGA
ncbi:MAG: hypothetical protein ACR2HR_07900 [Euzebya sp.]